MSGMKEKLETRLASLRQEYSAGQEQLRKLEERRNDLQQTMLRITGAIQVLEEAIADEN